MFGINVRSIMKNIRISTNSMHSKTDTNGILKIEKGLNRVDSRKSSFKFKLLKRKWFIRKSQICIAKFTVIQSKFDFFFSFSGKIECLKLATRKDSVYNGSFQEAIGSILALGQIFAVMPVVGITMNDASKLRFKWDSFRTIYSGIMFVLVTFYSLLTLFSTLRRKEIHFDVVGMTDDSDY